MGVKFMLRGREEPATLTWGETFVFRLLSLVSSLGEGYLEYFLFLDKTAQVSVTNPDNTGIMDASECVNDHSTCVVHWT